MSYTFASILFLSFALIGCDKVSSPTNEKSSSGLTTEKKSQELIKSASNNTTIENGSPDLAVKSWWKIIDLREQHGSEECKKNENAAKPEFVDYYPKVAQDDLLRAITPKVGDCSITVYDREIQEVKSESETRSIVYVKVKNVTPVPEGAEPDDYDKKYRKDGFRFKYLVEKSSEGWKVSQVYSYDEFNKNDPWKAIYKYTGKPIYPAFVFTQ